MQSLGRTPESKGTSGELAPRSFEDDVMLPIQSLTGLNRRLLGPLEYAGRRYPLIVASPDGSAGENSPWILISGGVHGDEPAGVAACVELLETLLPSWSHRYRFVVLPCINPSGFELDQLPTANGANLNRLFGIGSSQPEVRMIEDWLAEFDRQFLATFDLHEVVPDYRGEGFVESDNPRGCYLYETQKDVRRRIGHQMIAALPGSSEVCEWPSIYNDRNDHGVVAYPESCGNDIYAQQTSFDAYLNGRYTNHSFTLETPTAWPLALRVQTHSIWVETALKLLDRQ